MYCTNARIVPMPLQEPPPPPPPPPLHFYSHFFFPVCPVRPCSVCHRYRLSGHAQSGMLSTCSCRVWSCQLYSYLYHVPSAVSYALSCAMNSFRLPCGRLCRVWSVMCTVQFCCVLCSVLCAVQLVVCHVQCVICELCSLGVSCAVCCTVSCVSCAVCLLCTVQFGCVLCSVCCVLCS